MKQYAAILVSTGLLVLMATLMATPIREESATMDEGAFLAAGYNYWLGSGFSFDPEAPPLAKLISAAPFVFAMPIFQASVASAGSVCVKYSR